jgi:hypothetical protein
MTASAVAAGGDQLGVRRLAHHTTHALGIPLAWQTAKFSCTNPHSSGATAANMRLVVA